MIQNSLIQMRARLGANEEGKYFFDLSVWDGPRQIGTAIGPFGPYRHEEDAAKDSVQAIKAAMYILSRWKMTLTPNLYYQEALKALKKWKTYAGE